MSATDELRRLLDERGVEHFDGTETTLWGYEPTSESTGVYRFAADETSGGRMQVRMFNLTPEQAVEATLGRGTCEILGYDDGYDEGVDGEMYQYVDPRYFLSCEHEAYGSVVPKYCPECGRKVVDEWA